MKNNQIAIKCHELSKIYKNPWKQDSDVFALKNVSFSITGGQIVGLIGPNGAGKSTILNLIAGLILPSKGSVEVCGFFPRTVHARRKIGYMPENPVLSGSYTSTEVLKYHGRLYGIPNRILKHRIDYLLDQLKLKDVAKRCTSGFSQGMKQRLALAVSIINQPDILLLDEPGNGLDPTGIISLRNFLSELSGSGTTILVSSHHLHELDRLASNYIFINKGNIVPFDKKVFSKSRVKIKMEFCLKSILDQSLPGKDFEIFQNEIVINNCDLLEIPDVIKSLVKNGVRITSVIPEADTIEDRFLELCQEKDT